MPGQRAEEPEEGARSKAMVHAPGGTGSQLHTALLTRPTPVAACGGATVPIKVSCPRPHMGEILLFHQNA